MAPASPRIFPRVPTWTLCPQTSPPTLHPWCSGPPCGRPQRPMLQNQSWPPGSREECVGTEPIRVLSKWGGQGRAVTAKVGRGCRIPSHCDGLLRHGLVPSALPQQCNPFFQPALKRHAFHAGGGLESAPSLDPSPLSLPSPYNVSLRPQVPRSRSQTNPPPPPLPGAR